MSGGTSPRYTSQGTISVSFRHKHEVLFFPEHDYSIKHGNKTFAVFMSVSKKPEPSPMMANLGSKSPLDQTF